MGQVLSRLICRQSSPVLHGKATDRLGTWQSIASRLIHFLDVQAVSIPSNFRSSLLYQMRIVENVLDCLRKRMWIAKKLHTVQFGP